MDNLAAPADVVVSLFCNAYYVYFWGDSLYGRSLKIGAIAVHLPQRAKAINGCMTMFTPSVSTFLGACKALTMGSSCTAMQHIFPRC